MAEQQDDRKNNPLNRARRHRRQLRVAVSPQHVGDVEDRRSSRPAVVRHGEHRLDESIEIAGRMPRIAST